MKIIVRAPNWMGDAVLSLPLMDRLHQNFPDGEIWIAGTEWVNGIYSSLDYLAGTIVLSQKNGLQDSKLSVHKIQKQQFDIGLLLTNSFASALLFYRAKIPERWGYARDMRGWLLTKRVKQSPYERLPHHLHYYLNLASKLGMEPGPIKLHYPLPDEDKAQAKNLLSSLSVNQDKTIAILSPGASYGPAKRWPAGYFSKLAEQLQETFDAEILIVGAQDETELAEAIASPMKKKPVLLTGKTNLNQLAGVIAQAAFFVTNDSGPMHLANALHTPVVAIFGPTDPRWTRPYQEPAVVLKKEVPCWPCFYRNCPYAHQCMTQIAPEEVVQACLTLNQ
ncbi:lipopolysaccharide heptosyltransferase II [Acidobacteriota bacterium]